MKRLVLPALVLGLALPAWSEGEVYKWVDKDGQIHITTKPPPKDAKRAPSGDDGAKKQTFIYQWQDKDGRFHITTEPPPPEGRLVEKLPNPNGPEGGATRSENSPAGRRAVGLERAPDNGMSVQGLRAASAVGARAPEIDGYNGVGDPISTADLRGRPVWVTFSTKFCRYCVKEAKVMAELDGEIDDASFLVVLGVDGDIDTAKKWAESNGLDPEQVIAGTPEVFPMGPVPHNVFIDRLGRVTDVKTGAMSADQVRVALQRLR